MNPQKAIEILMAFAICHSTLDCKKYCPLYESGDDVDGIVCKQYFIGSDGRSNNTVESAILMLSQYTLVNKAEVPQQRGSDK